MSLILGTFGVILASIFWGSNCVVVRGYDLPADGMHFVLLMSTGILLVGILSLFNSPYEDGDFEVVFAPEGLAGGIVWACGNFLTVPIIRNCGLGLGFATWSGVNLVVAFVVGTVGVGQILPGEALNRPELGGGGILLAIIALILFSNVKPVMESTSGEEPRMFELDLDEPFLDPDDTGAEREAQADSEADGEAIRGSQSENIAAGSLSGTNKPLGISFGVSAGIFYGFQFVPLSIWHNKVVKQGHIFDQDIPSELSLATRFFFSQYAGTYLASLVAFTAYCLLNGNEPRLVPPAAVLPSILSGCVWAIGCAGGILATAGLGNAVGFPLLLNGAFLVNSSWSIFYFDEIKGRRNLQLFACAFLLNLISSILISLSKL